jgi:hypothetical protein
MAECPTVLVSGAIANKHRNGGEAWVRLNWVLGLRRLGFRVYFVEQIQSNTCVDDVGAPAPFERSANLKFFRDTVRAFDLVHASSLIRDDGPHPEGLSYDDMLDVAGTAEVLINISGHLTLEPILRRVRRKAYIDLDPGFTQFWHAAGLLGSHLAAHDFFFTVGENIGTPACQIPTGGLTWRRKRRFLVLDQWPVCRRGDPNRFTTVAAWRGAFGPVEHGGRRYGLKVHEFRKFISLPRHASQAFEIALSIHSGDHADLEALQAHGWTIADPRQAAPDPLAFRRYVQGSGGEFSVAQGIYVETNSGWLSDRTVRYLASGKPCLVQDTGFSRNYPVGEGLVAFRSFEEAVTGAERIAADYERHSLVARKLAETYFASDQVLPDMLGQMGVPLPVNRVGA